GSESSLQSNADSIYNHSFQPNGFKRDDQSDKRIEYLEEQVKIIPELEVKLTLLKEEKRQLMKLLDNEKNKCAKLEEKVTSSQYRKDRSIRNFDVGVQVQEHDLKVSDPLKLLQIVEKVDCGVQATSNDDMDRGRSRSPPKICVLTKNASILAKPKTGDVGYTIK
ncbi:unnamed protein product, partial [Orchesella dallaii]